MEAYGRLRVSDLRDIVRSCGLKGWSKLRKDNLISFIIGNDNYLLEQQIGRRRQERLERATAEANMKLEKKAKSKARRQAKRDEAGGRATRRSETGRDKPTKATSGKYHRRASGD